MTHPIARSFSLLVAVWLLGGALPAHANDSAIGAFAGQLRPVQETRIHMEREDIVLEERGGDWHVTARYWFSNPTNQPVTLRVGFPERDLCAADGDTLDPSSRDMHIWIDDEEAEHEVVALASTHPEAAADCTVRAFAFDLSFPPGATRQVDHRYVQSASAVGDWGSEITYVTVTGANWAGPIGHARFTFRRAVNVVREVGSGAPARPALAFQTRYTTSLELQSARQYFDAGERISEVVLAGTDWTPQTDLTVTFYTRAAAFYSGGFVHPIDLPEHACVESEALLYMLENAEDRRRAVLAELTDSELRVARNAAYAAHGYPFQNEELREFFYRPARTLPPSASGGDSPSLTAFEFAPNADYSDGLITPLERLCIAAVRAEERRRSDAAMAPASATDAAPE